MKSNVAKTPATHKELKAAAISVSENDYSLTVTAAGKEYRFSKKDGSLVKASNFAIAGPSFICAKRSDRSQDGFYNHDDKEAEKKKTQYTTYMDQGAFTGFTVDAEKAAVKANYKHGSLESAEWTFLADGSVKLDYAYTFGGVVDEMGISFAYPESKVKSKEWVGDGTLTVFGRTVSTVHSTVIGRTTTTTLFRARHSSTLSSRDTLQTAHG